MLTLNLTQHIATADQESAGVVNVPRQMAGELTAVLTVPASLLVRDDAGELLIARANALVALAIEA